MRQFNNTWIDPDSIVSVSIDWKMEFNVSGKAEIAKKEKTDKATKVSVILNNAVVLVLEQEDAQAFADWWTNEWDNL